MEPVNNCLNWGTTSFCEMVVMICIYKEYSNVYKKVLSRFGSSWQKTLSCTNPQNDRKTLGKKPKKNPYITW